MNAAGRNSRDAEGVENSNSVQKSGAENDIVNAEVDIVNAAGRNLGDEERVEKTVIQFKRVELKMTLRMPPVEIQEMQKALKTVIQFKRVELNMTLRMPKLTLGIPQVEIQETQNALKTATPNPVMKNMPTLQPKRKTLQLKRKTQKLKKVKLMTPKQFILQKKRAWLWPKLKI